MKQRNLPNSGLRVSEIGLSSSTWDIVENDALAQQILSRFIEAGGNLIDLGFASHSSRIDVPSLLGKAERSKVILSASSGVDRRAVLGQRVNCSRANLLRELDSILEHYRIDHLDIWSLGYFDESTPSAEIADTINFAIATGKVRYVILRDHHAWQGAILASHCSNIVGIANEYSLVDRGIEEHVLPMSRHLNLGVFAHTPLARGILAEPHNFTSHSPGFETYSDQRSHTIADALSTAAHGLGKSPASVALNWVLQRSQIASALVGVTHPDHIDVGVEATGFALPTAIRTALDDVSR